MQSAKDENKGFSPNVNIVGSPDVVFPDLPFVPLNKVFVTELPGADWWTLAVVVHKPQVKSKSAVFDSKHGAYN